MDSEYYILCPQRPDNAPGLITHLISVDICAKRQTDDFHKCPNCVRSAVYASEHKKRRQKKAPAKE